MKRVWQLQQILPARSIIQMSLFASSGLPTIFHLWRGAKDQNGRVEEGVTSLISFCWANETEISNSWICYLVAGKICTVLRLRWLLLLQNNDRQVCATVPHALSLLKEKLIVKFFCHITQLRKWICNSSMIYVHIGQLAKRMLRMKIHKMRLVGLVWFFYLGTSKTRHARSTY